MNYPFSAVVGQHSFKLALLLAAINPLIGGVLVSGPRGSAKSTLARAFADLLPDSAAFVTLPLGASEEMLIGSLDLQQALAEQQLQFSPGLLAKAHQGVLYVDEVNLLPDALVDVLLDVAASKVNRIERDGVSHQHEADFILIGTMNPDEGELRPQLQDRFGLCVELSNQYSIAERVEIVQLRDAFDSNAAAFSEDFSAQQQALQQQIQQAQASMAQVQCSIAMRTVIAERCFAAQVDGMRADLVWYRAAVAHAAWQGHAEVSTADIDAVEALVLAHRRQAQTPPPPQQPPSSPPPFSRPPSSQSQNQSLPSPPSPSSPMGSVAQQTQGDWGSLEPQPQCSLRSGLSLPIQAESNMQRLRHRTVATPVIQAGRKKGQAVSGQHQGQSLSQRIHWFHTLSRNHLQGATASWRWHYRPAKTGQAVLHLVLLDTSASVLAQQAFAKAKGVIMQIAREAYLARERLSILGFGNQQVQTLLLPVRAPKQIQHLLDTMSAAGGTPLQAALQQTQSLLVRLKRQQADLQVLVYIMTDGRVSTLPPGLHLDAPCYWIDTELSEVKRGRGRALAHLLGAEYITLGAKS